MNYFVIAVISVVTNVILLLLIIFRKIGRPLSETEAQYKIERRKQRQKIEQMAYQKRMEDLQLQENLISGMPKPIILVSAGGNDFKHDLCVQDGKGKVHTLSATEPDIKQAPYFSGLFNASHARFGNWKNGTVLVP